VKVPRGPPPWGVSLTFREIYSVFRRFREYISPSDFVKSTNILVSKGVDRVEAPVVALVTNLVAEGAAAGSAATAGRWCWWCWWCRLSLLDHLADLHVRVALAVRDVAHEIEKKGIHVGDDFLIIRYVREEDPGGRARWWLRRVRRGHPCFPLGRWRIGAEPWCGREVLNPARRVGWRDRRVDRALAGGAGFPEVVLEKVPFTLQKGHLVVEHGDVPPEQVDLPVGLAGCPRFRSELVAAEGTLLFPKLSEARLAGHVAAFHDCGIGVGEVFQADATLGGVRTERLQDQPAHVSVNHFVTWTSCGSRRHLNDF